MNTEPLDARDRTARRLWTHGGDYVSARSADEAAEFIASFCADAGLQPYACEVEPVPDNAQVYGRSAAVLASETEGVILSPLARTLIERHTQKRAEARKWMDRWDRDHAALQTIRGVVGLPFAQVTPDMVDNLEAFGRKRGGDVGDALVGVARLWRTCAVQTAAANQHGAALREALAAARPWAERWERDHAALQAILDVLVLPFDDTTREAAANLEAAGRKRNDEVGGILVRVASLWRNNLCQLARAESLAVSLTDATARAQHAENERDTERGIANERARDLAASRDTWFRACDEAKARVSLVEEERDALATRVAELAWALDKANAAKADVAAHAYALRQRIVAFLRWTASVYVTESLRNPASRDDLNARASAISEVAEAIFGGFEHHAASTVMGRPTDAEPT